MSIAFDRHRKLAWALLALLIALSRPSFAQQVVWTTGASMPGASYGLRGAFVNGKFYAISGFATNRIGIYDPASNSWTTGAPLPQFPPDTGYNLRQYFGCAVVGAKIYVIGGDTGGSGARDTNYVYDTNSDSWTSGAPMPGGARYGIAAVTLNGLIYVIGGVDANGTLLSRVEIYNPSSDSWTTGVPLPGALQGMVAEAINGRIYVAGGSTSGTTGGPQTNTFVFDGASWSSKQQMPIAGNGGSAVVNGKMFVVGCGSNGASSAVNVQAYDPQTDSWSTNYPPLPLGRGDGGVASDPANGIIYDAGGYNGVNGGFLDEVDILPIGSGLPVITNPIDLDYLSTVETFDPASGVWASHAQMPTARQAFGMAVASGGQDGTWSTGPDMPNAAYAVQAATVNGKIYAISGFRFGAQQPGESDTRIFNPATNSWSLGAPVPDDNTCSNFQENGFCYTLRQFAGCAALNGKIYVIGGDTGGTGFEATNLIYDTVANRWSNGAILPGGPRDNLASVALNGKIYTIGGFNGNANTYFSRVDIYDPISNSWTAGTPLPGPRAGMAAAATNGKIYVTGGQDANGSLTDALVFDPAANTWTNIASPPFTNQYCAVLGGKLFIVGGGGNQNIIEAYDPVTNTWSTSFAPMLTPRGAVAAATDDALGTLYTIGGDNGPFSFNILSTFEILSIGASNQKIYVAGGQNIDNVCSPVAALESYNPTTDSWASLSPMPTARSDLSAATVNNIIYFIGGSSCAGTVGTVEAYNPSAKQWTNPQAPLQSMTVPRSDTGSAVLNNKVYVFGGNDANGVPQPVLEVYDPAQDQWTRLNDMPSARSMLAGAAFGGKIYAFGGFDGANPTGDVEAYDPGSDSWTPLASMPTPRFASGAGVVNNTIHIFGGAAVPAGGATISHEVATDEVYDPATNTWSTAPSLPTARFGLGGAAINNQLYAVGGLLRGIASVNHLFVYQITATNQPSSYSVESADPNVPLPAWLQIDPTSGMLFGRPDTESHDIHIKVTATNSGGSSSAFLTFSVQSVASSDLEIVSSTSVTGKVGKQFGPNGKGFQVLAQNSTASAKCTAGGLPPGLSIGESSGLISGTPTSPGNFAVSLAVTDTGGKANSILQLTIVSDSTVPILTSSDSAFLSPGRPFSLTLTADAAATFSYVDANGTLHQGPTSAGLPPGLMFDGVNLISGTYTPGNGPSRSSATEPIPGTSGIRRNTITIRPPRVANCQPIATNSTGTGTGPLNFFSGYPITLNTSPTVGGTVSGVYNSDSSFTAVADANTGYDFVSWTENGQLQSASKSYTFTPTSARTLVANFSVAVTPAVSLHVSSKTVRKGGSVTFMANASAINQSQPIVVNYTMSGKALLGTDYTLSANQITIPPGQPSGSVTFQVITTQTKGSETATMTLQPGTGYTVVTKKKANRASVKIVNK